MSPQTGSPASMAQWHAVTPMTRPLSISILELAPTSVTLALTRSPPSPIPGAAHLSSAQHVVHSLAHSHHQHSHSHSGAHGGSSGSHSTGAGAQCGPSSGRSGKKKKKSRNVSGASATVGSGAGATHTPDSDENDDDEDSGSNQHIVPGAYPSLLAEGQTFKDMLSHGVVVTLDGMPWSRIVAHVSDDTAEEDGAGDDDEGEWEDDEEAARDEETVGTTSGTAPHAARRRKGRRPSGVGSSTRPLRSQDKPHASNRWDRERAVVVVYDLDPSKEHEIELQIVGLSGELKEGVPVSNTVLIPPAPSSGSNLHPRSRANSLRSRSRPRSRSNSVNLQVQQPVGSSPLATESASPGSSSTPSSDQPVVPTSILSPIDAQTAQTRHLIAAAHAERELLQVQIKEARKTAQRSEAALRTEIESMKKSNDKAGSNDQRNRQKYLALQEQVKQGWAGSESATTEAEEVQARVPDLEKRLASVKADVESVRTQWKQVKKAEEEAREEDKKDRAEEDKRLADISNKVDKVRARKEKKDAERAELQKKLEDLERQKEELEHKADEERNSRRQGYYPALWNGQSQHMHPGGGPPFGAPGGFRGRGGFPHRFASGGRPPPTQPSPPVGNTGFDSSVGPGPGGSWGRAVSSSDASTSSTWSRPSPRPPQLAVRPGVGTNPSAAPFMPSSNFGSPPAAQPQVSPVNSTFDSALHTAFMPPQFQHRIYLPNSVRPRPTPNFHPPPSVLAAQAEQTAVASSSGSSSASSPMPTNKVSPMASHTQPAFPPLPTQAPPARPASNSASGPSLASIVTRAVLAPTSAALANTQNMTSAAPGAGRPATSPTQASSAAPSRPGDQPLSPTAATYSSPQQRPSGAHRPVRKGSGSTDSG